MIGAPWPVTLRAGALVLRPLEGRDQGAYEEIRTASQAWLTPWDATHPPEVAPPHFTFTDMLHDQQAMARAGRSLPWVLAWDDGWPARPVRHPRMIGQVSVNGVTWASSRSAFIGYWIDQRWAGRGLVPLGAALAADYCFHTLLLHRLEINILPENVASRHVIDKLGFSADGTRRSILHIHGAWRDHEAFVMTADEAPPSLVDHVLAGRPVPTN